MMDTIVEVLRIYDGSDGTATSALYKRLEQLGPLGTVAVNLFRAQKCSERAKVYRGRGYRDEAYRRKQWSMDNLCEALHQHAVALNIQWGWKIDPDQSYHSWVLYVELPSGQVSYHTDKRGKGPDFAGEWDQHRGVSPQRIIKFVANVIEGQHGTQFVTEAGDPGRQNSLRMGEGARNR